MLLALSGLTRSRRSWMEASHFQMHRPLNKVLMCLTISSLLALSGKTPKFLATAWLNSMTGET
jgi:hypothetical protein